ncbi:Protein of unknown function, partial [Cotesia congregata]
YWLDRMKKEKPAYLTITSLELPDSPIPLIDSQASARFRATESSDVNFEKDEILDEFIENMTKLGKGRKKATRSAGANVTKTIERARKQFIETKKYNRALTSLRTSTKTIAEGPPKRCTKSSDVMEECICAEITENLKINIQEKTEVNKSSRSPSPEVTHTIRIAMKYLGQPGRREQHDDEDNNDDEDEYRVIEKISSSDELSNILVNQQLAEQNQYYRDTNCCAGINVALDFTLNCNGVQLTSRDISLKPVTKDNSNID